MRVLQVANGFLPTARGGAPSLTRGRAGRGAGSSFGQGGIVNAICDGENGQLLPPGNVEARAETLRQSMAEPERIACMSAARRGEKVRSTEENAAEMEALYEKILAGRAPSGS